MTRVEAWEKELADIEREMNELPAVSEARWILARRRSNAVEVLGIMKERRSPVSRRMRRFKGGLPL